MSLPEIEKALEAGQATSPGPLDDVIIHNDDVTPMDFVLAVLGSVFHLAGPHAYQVMLTAHYHGSAYVQTLPHAEAVRRVGLAHTTAALQGFPLRFSLQAAK